MVSQQYLTVALPAGSQEGVTGRKLRHSPSVKIFDFMIIYELFRECL